MNPTNQGTLVESVVQRLLGLSTRWEIPDPVFRSLASRLSSSLADSVRLLGLDDPEAALRAAFGVPANATTAQQGEAVARILHAVAAVQWPSISENADPPDPPDPPSPAPLDLDKIEELDRLFDELVPNPPIPWDEFDAFETDFEQISTTSSRRSLEQVLQMLTRMLQKSREWAAGDPERDAKYPHRLRFEDSLSAEVELGYLESRYHIAEQLAQQARANPDLRAPGRSVGNDVHAALQTRYLMSHSADNVIIQEWWVFFPGARRRTITAQVERELREPDQKKRDYTFFVVEKTRLPKRGRLNARERWDTLDLSRAGLWEIKPLFRLHEAVLQESYYRYKYCFNALPLLDPEIAARVLVPWIDPGSLYPVHDPYSGELLIQTRFGELAVPLEVQSSFPGLVPYVVLRRTRHTDVVRMIQRVGVWIAAAYAKMKRKLLELRAKILIALLIVVLIVLVAVIVVFVLARALEDAVQPPPKQLPEPQEQPVPNMGRERARQPAGIALAPGTFISVVPAPASRGLRIVLNSSSLRETAPPLNFGAVTIEGIPMDRFGDFITMFMERFDAALCSFSTSVSRDNSDPMA